MSYALSTGVPARRGSGPAAHVRSGAMLLVFVLIGAVAGAIGILASLGAVLGWYPPTPRVNWAPPAGVIPAIRAGLLIAMGVAEWLVWLRRRERPVGAVLGLFVVQQAMTMSWPVLFSAGYGVIGLADLWICFGVLLVLDLLVVLTTIAFWPVSRPASAVMLLHLLSCLLSTVLVLGSAAMHAVL